MLSTRSLREGDQDIFQIALSMVSETGLSGLTAREISKRCGLSPSGFLYRFGTRDAFLADFASWVILKDEALWEHYTEQVEDFSATESLRAVSLAIIVDRVQHHRETLLAMWEFQLLASRLPSYLPFLTIWRQQDVSFWARLLPKFGLPSGLAAGWAGSLLGCMRVGVLADPGVSRQLWMDDIVTRLTERTLDQPISKPGDSFPRRAAEKNLHPPNSKVHEDGSTQSRIIRAASEIIMEDGCAALSHRAIAKRAKVSLSSTTHHFQSLNDILSATFDAIYASAREQAEKLPRENRTYTRQEFTQDILPSLTGPQQMGRAGALAADDIMLCAARDQSTRKLSTALIALGGATTRQLIAGIQDSSKAYDRLDAHIVRLCLNGAMCGADLSTNPDGMPLVASFLETYL